MNHPLFNWKTCWKCGKKYDIGINKDTCPECRMEKLNNCPDCNCQLYDYDFMEEKKCPKGKKYCLECMNFVIPVEEGHLFKMIRKRGIK